MYRNDNWAAIVPMANEEGDFLPFIEVFIDVLNRLQSGHVFLIIDKVSKDQTLNLCKKLSDRDDRFTTIWAPENCNVVDAYLRGYREAYDNGHDPIIEMDAGLSHDPRALPMFLRVLNEGNECAFGSRFINGGSMADSVSYRRRLSKVGTILCNALLGTSMFDMTSGFQGFHRSVVGEILGYNLLSKAHFYQSELRYLLRKKRFAEIPIHYRAPSKSVSQKAIKNSIQVLLYYFFRRLTFSPAVILPEVLGKG